MALCRQVTVTARYMAETERPPQNLAWMTSEMGRGEHCRLLLKSAPTGETNRVGRHNQLLNPNHEIGLFMTARSDGFNGTLDRFCLKYNWPRKARTPWISLKNASITLSFSQYATTKDTKYC
jgi:hypothetical protein